MSFIPPAVKAKRNAVNFSYNVGRGKLDYPSLFFPFSFFLSFFDFIPRFVIVFVQPSFGDSDFGDSVASFLILEIFFPVPFLFSFLFSYEGKMGRKRDLWRKKLRKRVSCFLPWLSIFIFFLFFSHRFKGQEESRSRESRTLCIFYA